ncbi:hypothetical protein FKM82_029595, partial [Ascaphus truei]
LRANNESGGVELLSREQPPRLNPWDVALCASGALIASENAVVLGVILSKSTLRAPVFLLIGSLAASDLLSGLGLILRFAFVCWPPSESFSLLTAGLLVTSFTASICSLLSITVDRYLSLYNALTYYSHRTLFRTYIMLALSWVVAAGFGVLPALGWHCLQWTPGCSIIRPLTKGNLVALSGCFFMVFGVMLLLYAQICKIVCKHAQEIAMQRHHLPANHYVTTTKGVSTLAFMLGTFATCWLPFAIYCLLGDHTYPSWYTYATVLPAAYNSMINPIIYAYRNQDIRKVLWGACCRSPKKHFGSRCPSDV